MPKSSNLVVSADGTTGVDGEHGVNGHGGGYSGNGGNGGHATHPTAGGNAQNVRVTLKRQNPSHEPYDPVFTAKVETNFQHCNSKGARKDVTVDLGSSGMIKISARGGSGGKGGKGGDGGDGADGSRGYDATRDTRGGDGSDGGNGGDAGRGTSGANGGDAGDVKIVVAEEDCDLLLALENPVVSGGSGGIAGRHGEPGRRGDGGSGGSSYHWYEYVRDQDGNVVNSEWHSTPGGRSGRDGRAGSSPTGRLTNGIQGVDGSVEIFIANKKSKLSGPYPSAWSLEVVDYDVCDSNDDGIIEFGEEIKIKNIRVRNSGGSPSPAFTSITIYGKVTNWLTASATKLPIPAAISPGATAAIPGAIVFSVSQCHEYQPGPSFRTQTIVSLQAHVSKIGRTIPGLNGDKSILLQHPIEISRPTFLRSMVPGQVATFSWTIKNKSTRDLGAHAQCTRSIATSIGSSPPTLLFNDISSQSQTQNLLIPVDLLEARDSNLIEVSVTVPQSAIPYSKTAAMVSLELTYPRGNDMAGIQHYQLPVQISSSYRHNASSEVLLVTNSGTVSDEVEMWSGVCDRLGITMDIWNLGLYGIFSESGGQSMFDLYRGKTMVFLSNSFEYFDRGGRTALDLINPRELFTASIHGTSFLFSGTPADESRIRQLLQASSSRRQTCAECLTGKEVLKTIISAHSRDNFWESKFLYCPRRKGKQAFKRCENKAKRLSKALQQRIPNVTFMILWTSSATGESNGEIEVFPILRPPSNALVTSLGNPFQSERIRDFRASLAISFSKRVEVLWNGWSDKKTSVTDGFVESVESELAVELGRYLTTSTWPDCIPKGAAFTHLTRLQTFLEFDWLRPFRMESIGTVTTLIGKLVHLVDGNSGALQRAFTFATRRNRLRVELLRKADLFLQGHYGRLGRNIAQNQLQEYLAAKKKEKTCSTEGVDDGTGDMVDVRQTGNIIFDENEVWKLGAEEKRLENQMRWDFRHAKDALEKMSGLPIYDTLPTYAEDITVVDKASK